MTPAARLRLYACGFYVLCGCGSSAGTGQPDLGADGGAVDDADEGSVAFSRAGDGALVVVDLVTRETNEVVGPGPFGAITASHDGTKLAYVNAEREVFILNLDGEVRSVGDTGSWYPSLRWEVGGWLWFPQGNTASPTAIVLPDSTERLVGTSGFVRLAASSIEARLAYVDCAEPPPQTCSGELVVERPGGDDHVVLTAGIGGAGVQFAPDGSSILTAETRGDQVRVISRPIDGGDELDLGPGNREMYVYGSPPGLSLFSPDGTEVLSMVLSPDESRLLALRLDGSGERTIAEPGPTYPWRAGFTPDGAVLYMQEINTEEPPDDTPVIGYTTTLVDGEGSVRALRDLDADCSIGMYASTGPVMSADGALLAYECGIVQRVSDGIVIGDFAAGGVPLGFTSRGSTLFLSGTKLMLLTGNGEVRELPDTFGSQNVDVEGLQAAYLPPND